jgi:3-deoxy-D-manno-octulosonic-acid transferase
MLGQAVLYLGSIFLQKWRRIVKGRAKSKAAINQFEFKNPVWMHCASLGEFEQGRPVLELIRKRNPSQQIVLSFFSPSGFDIQYNSENADLVFFLPADLPWVQRRLVQKVNASKFIGVKYEFWWNMLDQLQKHGTKIYHISAVFRDGEYFWTKATPWFRKILEKFEGIYVQDKLSGAVLTKNKVNNFSICGDTRIDRVISRALQSSASGSISNLINGRKVIIYGSVWEHDMFIVDACIQEFADFVHIVATHEVDPAYVSKLFSKRTYQIRTYTAGWLDNDRVLVLNTIGHLSSMYSLADYVYIGGGFGRGIHNILEPCAQKVPVFYGPNHLKFNEAVSLAASGCTFVVNEALTMVDKIKELESSPQKYNEIEKNVDLYLTENAGASERIYRALSF